MSRQALEFIGMIFETKISLQLREEFPEGVVLNNVSVYCPSLKKETQIDVILILDKGIFVIEAKNFVTSMKGFYRDAKWELRSRDKKAKFVFNSYDQNVLHVRSLNSAIYKKFGVKPGHLYNLVCFPDSTFFKTDVEEVCHLSDLAPHIRKLYEESQKKYDIYEWAKMIRKIDSDEQARQAEIYGLLDTRVTHMRAREE